MPKKPENKFKQSQNTKNRIIHLTRMFDKTLQGSDETFERNGSSNRNNRFFSHIEDSDSEFHEEKESEFSYLFNDELIK